MKKSFLYIFIIVLLFGPLSRLNAQISQGGLPYSFDLRLSADFNYIDIDPPDLRLIERSRQEWGMKPAYVGPVVPVNISLTKDGSWSYLPDGSRICRLGINFKGAKAVALYYQSFFIPTGGKLFIYASDRRHIIGAYTEINNKDKGSFATELVAGDDIILEYYEPSRSAEEASVVIYEMVYAIENVSFLSDDPGRGFGDSGDCMVNVNCPEGSEFRRQKRGVARILLKEQGSTGWCTGSLINNALQDGTPYFFTADHCGEEATIEDYELWIFYFNYESLNCSDPLTNPGSQSLSGSTLIANDPNNSSINSNGGSDFKLLLLNFSPPPNYNPYFLGWSRLNTTATEGVCIHHPKGDIKKISTYTERPISTTYLGNNENPDEKYWRVYWAETESNHGVTEAGSSGSPLIDNQGRIIGALTGGYASCLKQEEPDYYGKFSYSWSSNGVGNEDQLAPWLDPDNTGVAILDGYGYGDILQADFEADEKIIAVGNSVHFTDISSGEPDSWQWIFTGGSPGNSDKKNPGNVKYEDFGTFDVKLIVYKNDDTDTLLKRDYISVRPVLYPNPFMDYIEFNFGRTSVKTLKVQLFDMLGREVFSWNNQDLPSSRFTVEIDNISSGIYYLKYTVDGKTWPLYPAEKVMRR